MSDGGAPLLELTTCDAPHRRRSPSRDPGRHPGASRRPSQPPRAPAAARVMRSAALRSSRAPDARATRAPPRGRRFPNAERRRLLLPQSRGRVSAPTAISCPGEFRAPRRRRRPASGAREPAGIGDAAVRLCRRPPRSPSVVGGRRVRRGATRCRTRDARRHSATRRWSRSPSVRSRPRAPGRALRRLCRPRSTSRGRAAHASRRAACDLRRSRCSGPVSGGRPDSSSRKTRRGPGRHAFSSSAAAAAMYASARAQSRPGLGSVDALVGRESAIRMHQVAGSGPLHEATPRRRSAATPGRARAPTPDATAAALSVIVLCRSSYCAKH